MALMVLGPGMSMDNNFFLSMKLDVYGEGCFEGAVTKLSTTLLCVS